MDRARWERIQEVFHAAAVLSAAEKETYLLDACRDDEELKRAVLSMLDEDARSRSWLDRTAARMGAHLLETVPRPAFTSVGPYLVREEIGRGGMGIVYRAERADLGRSVAVKILSDAWVSDDRVERFTSEQRLLAQLTHPSIARLYDAGILADGTPWFAMEYVKGARLDDYCAERSASLDVRLHLFREVAEAVRYAHQHLVIHRDLKPSNILVAEDGRVKLLDFGIARQLDAAERPSDRTETGFRLLTPSYAAPEQLRGESSTVQTDVYALGVILYELLAGRRPFERSTLTPAKLEAAITETAPATPSSMAAGSARAAEGVSRAAWADLDVLCLTTMHRDRARRYRSVEGMIRDLDAFTAGAPLEARVDSLAYRAGKLVRRRWRALTATAAAIAIVVGLVGFYTGRLASARNQALAEAQRTTRLQQFMLGLFDAGEEDVAPAADLRVLALVDRGVKEAAELHHDLGAQAELRDVLGTIYQRLGRYEEADQLLAQALEQRRRLYGADHATVGESLVSLGLLRIEQASHREAERLIREGLETETRVLPASHPELARATAALGKVLEETGDYPRAIAVLEEAVRRYRAAGSSTGLAATLSELANTHFYAGHMDAAESINSAVLAMNRRLHGDRHPNVADDLLNLGAIQSNRGRYSEAVDFYREALVIVRDWYGVEHPETASAMAILAQGLAYQEQYDESARLLEDALAIQTRVYGPMHLRVGFILNEIGTVALRQARLDAAHVAFTRSLDIVRSAFGGAHFRVGIALSNLASVAEARGDHRDAEARLREALGVFVEALGPTHMNVAICRIKLGRSLVRQQRYTEAEPDLLAGYEVLSKQAAPSVRWLQSARGDLVRVYEATGQPEKAQPFR